MMEHSNNIKDRILSLIKSFNSLRDTLVDGLLDVATTPETKLWVMEVLTNERLLPFGDWVDQCPKSMNERLETDPWYPERYRTVTFREMLFYMTDDKALEHPELVNEFFDYIKEHRIIGTVIDW